MKISVILGHPTPGSFNHALAQTVVETLRGGGHEVIFHDLYAEGFDPVMAGAEIPRGAAVPALVERHAAEMGEAEGLVVVHPNWWCTPPAVLKGWVDRVFRPGRAYQFVPDGKGGGKSQSLLKLRAALVVNTANNPQEKEVEMYGDPLEVFWRRVVFSILEVPRVERSVFAPVIASSPAQRQQWLCDAALAAQKTFGG